MLMRIHEKRQRSEAAKVPLRHLLLRPFDESLLTQTECYGLKFVGNYFSSVLLCGYPFTAFLNSLYSSLPQFFRTTRHLHIANTTFLVYDKLNNHSSLHTFFESIFRIVVQRL